MPTIDSESELRTQARAIARRIVAGEVTPYDGALQIWKELIDVHPGACPDDLWPFTSNASAIEDIRWNAQQGGAPFEELIRECEREIVSAAERLVHEL